MKSAPVIGHSFGGMMAAEFAASNPERVSKLVLMCPIGLWREDAPIPNWMIVTPASDMAKYSGPRSRRGPWRRRCSARPTRICRFAMIWCMACTGKFVWPIPDKGLKKRIHRIQAPTMVLWGKQDELVPAAYAQEFARRIPGANSRSDRSGRTRVPDRTTGTRGSDGGRFPAVAATGRRNCRRPQRCPSPL